MGPHADFACLSKKCQQDGSASVYDLPVSAIRCPVCGSRRLRRLYNSIQVMKSGFRPLNQVVDKALAEVGERYHDQRDARLGAATREAPALAVPIKQLAGALRQFGVTTTFDTQAEGRPKTAPFHPVAPALQDRGPLPGPGSQEDRESKVPR